MIKNKYYKIGNLNKRICLLSDIHYSFNYNESLFDKILENIVINKPDYICIPGDIVDSSDILFTDKKNNLTNFIKNLSKIAPVILSKGNHDETKIYKRKHSYLSNEEYFLSLNKINNVYYLNNETLVRDNITFTGLSLNYNYYYDKNHEDNSVFIKSLDKTKEIDIKKYNILLSHSPRNILIDKTLKESTMIKKFDLVISGHIHNGLVFNFLDKNSTRGFIGPFNHFFPKYAKGLSKKIIGNKEINLIISGGIIKFSENAPKLLYKINNIYPIHIEYIDI